MLGGKLAAASTLKVAAAVLGVLSLSIGGAWAVGIIGAPSVVGVNNAFGPVNESTTTIESELVVNNPNPFGVRLGGLTVDYAVEMNDVRMATGGREGVGVNASGNTSIPLTTMMNNDRIPTWWVSHVENDENTTLTVDASIHSDLLGKEFNPQIERPVNTNVIGGFNSDEDRPIDVDRPAAPEPVLWLNSTSGEWGAVDNETTEIDTAFDLYNPNPTPVAISEIGYEIEMNNVTMGEGTTEKGVAIAPGQTETVRATTALRNENLDEWWVSHLQNEQTTQLEVTFYARIDLSAFGGDTVRIQLDSIERTIETDIFGEGDGNEPEGTPTPDGEGTATPTDGDGTATPEDGTATPDDGTVTPDDGTPTPTDDGILAVGGPVA
ncbi:LEA type 2 family protein [Halolamina sp. CBA1230]|uniref:LEA type 2 family protein n=1 Tax=Halolamina sp. CBA1230 TaxID=1853690 RepID=UPI0009A1755B|nr:LEA type 2 family protein [Halolamina sp. CBA1230]QKY19447.1 LEA type 2 family protein [Halolamina sp. CBA1230]